MTYFVTNGEDKHNYQVVEKETSLVVFETHKNSEARAVTRKLNLGSGFQGFTPKFFIHSFKQKERSTES